MLARKAARPIREMPGQGFEDLVLLAESPCKGEVGVALLAEELNRAEFAAMPFLS